MHDGVTTAIELELVDNTGARAESQVRASFGGCPIKRAIARRQERPCWPCTIGVAVIKTVNNPVAGPVGVQLKHASDRIGAPQSSCPVKHAITSLSHPIPGRKPITCNGCHESV